MNKITCLVIAILTISTISFSQETKKSNQPLTRQEYLQKSKNQKLAAWVLLGVGVASIAIVAPGNSDFGTTGTFAVIGGISIITSIPLFIASGKNKRKGMALSAYLNLEKISTTGLASGNVGYLPSFSVKLHL